MAALFVRYFHKEFTARFLWRSHEFIAQFVYFPFLRTINTNETFQEKSHAHICLDMFPLNTLLTV